MLLGAKQVELLIQRSQIPIVDIAREMNVQPDVINYYIGNGRLSDMSGSDFTDKLLTAIVNINRRQKDFDPAHHKGQKLSYEDGLMKTIMYYDSVPSSDSKTSLQEHVRIFNWLSELAMYRKIGLLSEVEKVREKPDEDLDETE